MSEDTDEAQVHVMICTLDAWFLLAPALTHDAVVAWLESIEVCDCEQITPPADNILEAAEIE